MADNRYRKASPPGSRHYYAARSSANTVFSSSFNPAVSRSGGLDAPLPSHHSSVYDTQPTKRYSYQDSSRGPVSTTHYTVRQRTNSAAQPDSRRPLSLIMQNSSPTRTLTVPVVSGSVRDDYRGTIVIPSGRNESSSRYLVPAVSHGRDHQRRYSTARAENDRSTSLNSGGVGRIRSRPEYHNAGGYNASTYSSRVKDDDFSYTGPREQFARDFPSRPLDRRESVSRRDRPVSVYEVSGYKDGVSSRRELVLPATSRQHDRLDRSNGSYANERSAYESEPERGTDHIHHRHHTRAPVVHQIRQDNPRDYSYRDDYETRPRIRRDKAEEDHSSRPRAERLLIDDVQSRSRKERVSDESPVRYKKDRYEEDGASRAKKERYVDDEALPRSRRDPVIEAEVSPKPRSREAEHDNDRDRVRGRDYDKDRDREHERMRDYDRSRGTDRLRPVDKSQKRSDDGRGSRSRDSSPSPGHAKAVAAGLGGLAAAGLAGAAIKGSQKAEDVSDGNSRKERRHRKHRGHHHDEDNGRAWAGDQASASDRKASIDAIERPEERKRSTRLDDSGSDGMDDGRQQQRHRRHKDRERSEVDAATQSRDSQEPAWADDRPSEYEDLSRRRRRSRAREEDPDDLERRIVSPGEDDRPRRVQLVEPAKEKEEFKPKGILKAPRTVPFPEDPNPTREGVAPLKDATKNGVPPNARWTKISRALVNPEALEKARERFEERDDYVIVLRVVSREEIEKLAEETRQIRAKREKEWQEDLERQRAKKAIKASENALSPDDQVRQQTLPLLDQVPANPSVDPRELLTSVNNVPTPSLAPLPAPAPVPAPKAEPVLAPVAPTTAAVPNIKLEKVESMNYSSEV